VQVHDFNGGILANGLFWTLDSRRANVNFSRDSRRASVKARNLSVVDSFFFGNPSDTPAVIDYEIEWHATGPAVARGLGTTVAPSDPGAFLGNIAPAVSTGVFSGSEMAFEFESIGTATTAGRSYAQIGTERNGVFLT
jgi:hypothetical protein